MILFGVVLEPFHRSSCSVVATLILLAQHVVKRSRPFTDEASKHTGPSSKSKPEGKRVLALAAVRREKSSPLIPAQETTQSDVKGQVKPSQAPGDRLHGVQHSENTKTRESRPSIR